jgi:transposase
MGRSYSLDLCERVLAFVGSGHSRRAAARHFGGSTSFAVKLLQRVERRGSARPARQGRPPGRGKLVPFEPFLIGTVEPQPDMTMPELVELLRANHGVRATPAMLSRFVGQRGFTYKTSPAGFGNRTRWRRREPADLDGVPPAAHAPTAGPSRLHRRDLGDHQDDPPARAQPQGATAQGQGALRSVAHTDLHCRPAL